MLQTSCANADGTQQYQQLVYCCGRQRQSSKLRGLTLLHSHQVWWQQRHRMSFSGKHSGLHTDLRVSKLSSSWSPWLNIALRVWQACCERLPWRTVYAAWPLTNQP
jgi:hypothetical protein